MYKRQNLTEPDIVSKLAHHFGRGIQVAVLTQGVKSWEELLILLTKWEGIDNPNNSGNSNETPRKNFQYQNQTKQTQSPQQQQHKIQNRNTNQKFNTNKVAVVEEDDSDIEQSKNV